MLPRAGAAVPIRSFCFRLQPSLFWAAVKLHCRVTLVGSQVKLQIDIPAAQQGVDLHMARRRSHGLEAALPAA